MSKEIRILVFYGIGIKSGLYIQDYSEIMDMFYFKIGGMVVSGSNYQKLIKQIRKMNGFNLCK